MSRLVSVALTAILVGCSGGTALPQVDAASDHTSVEVARGGAASGGAASGDAASGDAAFQPTAEPTAPGGVGAANPDGPAGLDRRGAVGASTLQPGDAVRGAPLQRRALELFDAFGAATTGAGPRVELADDVLFDVDDDRLKVEAQALIADLGELARLTAPVPILVLGHTDGRGTARYNRALSRRRADAVALALVEGGTDPARIDAQGRGSTEPVAVEGGADDEQARARNRRVEVLFLGLDLDG